MNPYPATRMTPTERRAELCAILALGLRRLRARQSSELSVRSGESSLHIRADQSGHATVSNRRVA
ncbi:hypothetical protein FHG71_20825 [Rubellimicrobium roseum]|uniref:Uncharacterized protein n=1 Tax=Rubellimicrobium roseum TaxID=687525 RepID=A0A5C4NA62_9RHOB|nr:hypothetical protein FHG71_20825 [Rubellimicrobium roseum]